MDIFGCTCFDRLVDVALVSFMQAFFTGLAVVVVITFAVRVLKLRGVTFGFNVENRDQESSD